MDGDPKSVPVLLPYIGKMAHYTDDIMLTCGELPLLQDALLEHLRGREWSVNPYKIQGQAPLKHFGEAFVWVRSVLSQKL